MSLPALFLFISFECSVDGTFDTIYERINCKIDCTIDLEIFQKSSIKSSLAVASDFLARHGSRSGCGRVTVPRGTLCSHWYKKVGSSSKRNMHLSKMISRNAVKRRNWDWVVSLLVLQEVLLDADSIMDVGYMDTYGLEDLARLVTALLLAHDEGERDRKSVV